MVQQDTLATTTDKRPSMPVRRLAGSGLAALGLLWLAACYPYPKAAYTSYGEMMAAGSDGVGKVVRFSVRRVDIRPDRSFVAAACGGLVGSPPQGYVVVRFEPAQQQRVANITAEPDRCEQVVFRIAGFDAAGNAQLDLVPPNG